MTNLRARILIVDDEFSVRDSLLNWFQKDGYEVEAASNGKKALEIFEPGRFDVAVVDIKMPGMDGVELQEHLARQDAELPVIMITAFASVDTAVRTLKLGAFDYVTKPVDPDELSHLVRRALEQRRLRQENVQLRETIDEFVAGDVIVGDSPPMKKVLELAEHVAKTDATVLIRGESGTGKELIARAIHVNSRRRYAPIIAVNCGGLPETLLESELFGHEKGAFTGAQYRRKGRLEMADGGTLFLDEVGSISLKTQVDLLRVLESHEFTRLGGTKPIKVDFRVICATNEELEKVRVTAPSRTEDAIRVRVEVNDTGIGIPASRQEAVFEGFVQADSSTTRRHQDAGLGLTIAHRLVGGMGGHLEVASEVGRGSTFWFEIPLRPAPRGQPAD